MFNAQTMTNEVMNVDQNNLNLEIMEDLENEGLINNSDPALVLNATIENDTIKMGK